MKFWSPLLLNNSGDPPSFDDVMLVPRYSTIRSRLDPNIQTVIGCDTTLDIPIISSPMDTVTGSNMATSIGSRGAMGILHRFMTIKEQSDEVMRIIEFNRSRHSSKAPVVPAIGIGAL